jgi:hypothetical protein
VRILGLQTTSDADELTPYRQIEGWARAEVAGGASVDEVVAEALKRIRNAPLSAVKSVATIGPACTPEESVEIQRRADEISSGRAKPRSLDDLMAASLRRALSDRR